MYVALLVFGVAIAAGGLTALLFGIPINEFGLGNTLILAGMIGLVGGLLLVGLAVTIRQLRQVVDALEARAVPGEAGAAPDAYQRAGQEAPAPPDPLTLPEEVLARPRDAARRPGRVRIAERPNRRPEPPAGDLLQGIAARAEELSAARADPARPERAAERATQAGSAAEPHEAPPQPTATPREQPPPPAERPAVVKSGVLNKMPYTLYLDGSIEAELPTGTRRFASIDELRAFLLERAGPYAPPQARPEKIPN